MTRFKLMTLVLLAVAATSACNVSTKDPAEKSSSVSQSAVAPPLGTTQSFAVLGGSTVTNTGATLITGNLGVSPGTAVTGFPPGLVVGNIESANAISIQAQSDATIAYNALAAQACDTSLTGLDLGGLTLTPGTYCLSSSAQLTGTLTLNAEGNPAAVFVFQIGSTLTTASNSAVVMINGASSCNVFWQVGSSATLGTGTRFVGNVVALTSITLATSATLQGRAIARNGAVTLDTNTVSSAGCSVAPIVDAGVVVDAGGPPVVVVVDAGWVVIDAGAGGAGGAGGGAAGGAGGGAAGGAGGGAAGGAGGGAAGGAGGGNAADAGECVEDAGIVVVVPVPDAGECVEDAGIVVVPVPDAGHGHDHDGGLSCEEVCPAGVVDLNTNNYNCGACGFACAQTESCVAGACVCN